MSAHSSANPPDELVRAVSGSGAIAVRALVGTALVREAAERHATARDASVLLGRALMGAVLLAAGGKDRETLQLDLRGDGPLGRLIAIADADGRVRGYAANPRAPGGLTEGARGEHRGGGVLAVVRHRPGSQPYTGIVPLVTGSVAQDLAHYLSESEQTRSAVALGVFLGPEGGVEAAGGFFVHALPGASDDEVEVAEADALGFPGPGELVRDGLGAREIAARLLAGLGSREIGASVPCFHCGCGRERVLRAVRLLGQQEIEALAARGEAIDVRCEFCGERYAIDALDLLDPAGRG